jgi:hypothetical protein
MCNHFRPRRHRLTASAYRQTRTDRQAVWQDVTWAESAADESSARIFALTAFLAPVALLNLTTPPKARKRVDGVRRRRYEIACYARAGAPSVGWCASTAFCPWN